MNRLTINLPKDVSALLDTTRITKEQLDAFVIAALKAWLLKKRPNGQKKVAWEDAFHENATSFAEEFIAENQALFDELAQK